MATTPILGLPLIDRNMFADVPKDMNALAEAIERAVGPMGMIALKSEVDIVKRLLNEHALDNVKHITKQERTGWNKAVTNINQAISDLEEAFLRIGNLDALTTQDKSSLVAAVNELFTSVSSGKAKVANATTEMGQPTEPTAEFATIADNIRKLGSSITGGGTLVRNGPSVRVSGSTPNMIPSVIIVSYNDTANRGRTVYWPGAGSAESVSYMLDGVSAFKDYPTVINRWNGGFTIDITHPSAGGGYRFIAIK